MVLDYRAMLRQKIVERFKANQAYSMRAFARDCGVSHVLMSLVLNGKRNLSMNSALKICKELEFDQDDKDYFVSLLEFQSTRDEAVREHIRHRLAKYLQHNEAYILELEQFALISDWHHFAILEMTKLTKPITSKSIARALGISLIEAESALQRLQSLKLIELKNGKMQKTSKVFETPTDTPSQYIRNYHRAVIEKAVRALEIQTVDMREISSITVAIDKSDIPAAKKIINRFKRELSQMLSRSQKKDSVYQCNVQFFRLLSEEDM